MTIRIRIDRPRCIGAGTCIGLAPTAFDWLRGENLKVDLVDPDSVDEELLREAALACPTQSIVIEEVGDLLPWLQLGRNAPARRVVKTFAFTDIVGSTNLAEALGDDAWQTLMAWHDETLRGQFSAHHGQEVVTTGDGFFVGFDSPDDALACAVAIQRTLADHRRTSGFAPQVRIGIHLAGAQQVGKDYRGKGVNEAARIAGAADGGEILASQETVDGTRFATTRPRTIQLKGVKEPMDVVTVEWK